ncbi:MAG: potassium-transporting ATPase subunit KdpC [Deltaproteobacteria bacterium]|nr:MAG: potassium-transporting ATPase subunit KdpC [Deltaproteobacteria bacterium]
MKKEFKISLIFLLVMTVLTGVIYPVGITLIAKTCFPHQAAGSLIVENGKILGSELIGQNFEDPKFLWSRLSATVPAYNAAASSGSNLGPSNPALIDNAKARIDLLKIGALKITGTDTTKSIPVDLVTSSASGLDPHISPAAAEYQVPRIAHISHLDEIQIRAIIQENTEGRTFGFLGEPRVNVLKVNLALHQLYTSK